ncbi:hypothetical protein ACH4SP_33870 [Streptomyces sp. NPDC021093]|uniref:hypothetical protein n=1 Tax=Streptomyces sp. NPDC021093 TaxID=3365112 RepID=UPI003790DAA4
MKDVVPRGLRGPRHPGHSIPTDDLGALALPVGDDGILLGDDTGGHPRILGLHRPNPYEVLLIGGLWTAQALALRTAGTGARVSVETGRTQAWTQLAQAAGGGSGGPGGGSGGPGAGSGGPGAGPASGQDCLTLYEVGRVPPSGATPGSPVLVVRDCGMRPPRGRIVSSPWQSVLTLLPYLSPVAPRLIRDSALVGVQRVSPDEAQQIGRLLGLTPEEVAALPGLGDGVTLWCAGRERHWVTTMPTPIEGTLIGPARRMD